ncbi:MAG TPA: prolipoprotein diacylglyceryl transferase family protein [Hymenobacter sp.]|jgi:phosphatidylglycerol:prolipoprotein diacylglycerol transferase|uniref:prolipoprotein diacylglyceryl transferase family protein n=1 Tax=Hymenobacter sp. TaxID=1898978 RepID=UPI002ED994A7
MTFPYSDGHDFYTPFYLLATLTNVLLLLVEGWRRGFPLRPWLTLVAASSLALILGTKLITHGVAEWPALLLSDAPSSPARSILGGGLAATLTALALRRWLGLSWRVLDALALPLCGALAVQCVGCVLTGCCFGQPTAAPWGLTYAAHTLPWWSQVQAGMLPATAAHCLPVAPTQLMALLLCAAVGGVLLATRHRRWPVGSWLLLQTGLLLLGRFGLSFWRDPAGEPVASTVHTVLGGSWTELQFGLLPLGLMALATWAWRVRRAGPAAAAPKTVAVNAPTRSVAVVLVMLALTAVLGRHALTLPEVLVVRALLLAVLVAEARAAVATLQARGPRLVGLPLSVLLAGLVLLSTAQVPAALRVSAADSTRIRRTTIITGGVLGNHRETEQDILSDSGCGGSQRLALQQQAGVVGGEVAVEKSGPVGRTGTWGGGVWVGQQRIDMLPLDPDGNTFITARDSTVRKRLADVHIYREVHRENGWLSTDVRLGLHIGSLGYYSYFGDGESKGSTPVMPELMVRIGKPSVLFAQADLGYGAENVMGGLTTRFGLGSGLGSANGSRLVAGYAISPNQVRPSLGFVSANLRLPGRTGFSLEPYYATNFARNYNLSLKLNYRISR